MQRHRKILALVICVSITGVLSSGGVQANEPPPRSNTQLAHEVRQALGLDAVGVATLGLSQAQFTALAQASEAFCQANREAVETALDRYQRARRSAARLYEHGCDERDPIKVERHQGLCQTRELTCNEKLAALSSACQTLMTQVNAGLGEGQRGRIANMAANRGLGDRVKFLTLTQEQYNTLWVARCERDRVLLHQKHRKNPRRIQAALAAYDAVVSATLTNEQVTDCNAVDQACAANVRDARAWVKARRQN